VEQLEGRFPSLKGRVTTLAVPGGVATGSLHDEKTRQLFRQRVRVLLALDESAHRDEGNRVDEPRGLLSELRHRGAEGRNRLSGDRHGLYASSTLVLNNRKHPVIGKDPRFLARLRRLRLEAAQQT